MVVGTLLLGHLMTGKVLGQRRGVWSADEGFAEGFIFHRDDVAQVPMFEAGG